MLGFSSYLLELRNCCKYFPYNNDSTDKSKVKGHESLPYP